MSKRIGPPESIHTSPLLLPFTTLQIYLSFLVLKDQYQEPEKVDYAQVGNPCPGSMIYTYLHDVDSPFNLMNIN